MLGDVLSITGLFVLGFVLILIELFLIPGFMGVGALGVAVLGVGCYLAWEWLGMVWGLVAIVVNVVVLGWGAWFFPRSKAAGRLALEARQTDDYVSHPAEDAALLGRSGTTVTHLRPSGIADIEGVRISVTTDGEYVESGREVRVIQVEGPRVVVAEQEAQS